MIQLSHKCIGKLWIIISFNTIQASNAKRVITRLLFLKQEIRRLVHHYALSPSEETIKSTLNQFIIAWLRPDYTINRHKQG